VSDTVICRFRVRADRAQDFEELFTAHWPLLHDLGLVTDKPSKRFRGVDPLDGGPLYFEIFTWRDQQAVDHAHEHRDVAALWDRMRGCMVEIDGLAQWEFPHVERL
jgi:hypothetical protein